MVLELDEKTSRVKIDLNGVSMWAKRDDLEFLQNAVGTPPQQGVLTRVSPPRHFCDWICVVSGQISRWQNLNSFLTGHCFPVRTELKLYTAEVQVPCASQYINF